MSDTSSLQPDPSMIGGVPKAPFVRLPDPAALFIRRAARFRVLARAGKLAPYLAFLGEISDAQNAILPLLAEPDLPAPDIVARAREFDMPPLDRNALKPDAIVHDTCRRLFEELAPAAKPAEAETALVQLRRADDHALDAMIANVSTDSVPAAAVAEHVYVAAALQVHFARAASRMNGQALVPVGVGVCPVCGGRPVASMVVGWYGAEGVRYAVCTHCATFWNEVRIKCLVCGSTKGVGYQEIDGGDGVVKAETCDECSSYVKIFYEHKNTALDPIADDVGSLGLDQLLSESAYRRAGINPYLAGI
jgi:FdhE protein